MMRWRLEREASEAEARKRQRREECRKLAEKARQEAFKHTLQASKEVVGRQERRQVSQQSGKNEATQGSAL